MKNPPRLLALAAVTLAAGIALTSCGSPLGHSGTTIEPVTLTSTWGNGPGGVGSDVLAALAEPGDSPVTVSPPAAMTGRAADDEEGGALAELQAGTADVSVIRADRLVEAGAESLAPLQAPLVVTNNEQAAAIAADPIAETLMSDLRDIGLVGIALAPGGLRHPFGYGEPLLGPADYEGQTINTRVGPGVDAIIAALGADVDHSVGQEREDGALSGRLRGIEVSLQQYQAVTAPAVLTTDVVLYEKFDVIVVRADAFDSLSPAQQEELAKLATKAVSSAVDSRQSEEEGFAEWCSLPHGAAVLAGPDQVAAIDAALEPVVDDLRADGAAATAIDRMIALHDGTVDPTPSTCEAAALVGDDEFVVEPVGDQTVLDGVWRLEVNEQELTDAGVNFHDAQVNAGVWTLTITNGIADVDQPRGENCSWQFVFAGDNVSLNQSYGGNSFCGGQGRGTFRIEGNTAYFDWTSQREYDILLDQTMFQHGLVKVG